MSKTTIEQQIIEAATVLLTNGRNPTLAAVREHLGSRGSLSTIHKYLARWKQCCLEKGCFKQVHHQHNKAISNTEWVEEKRILKQNLNKQIEQNEHYVQELINAEKNNVVLKEENHQLQIANQELNLRLTAAEAANNSVFQVTQEINNRLDTNENKTIRNMQQTIDNLRLELKILNESGIAALRETSNQGHEALMKEKVTSINLQAKIDILNKELLESKKQLNESIMSAQVQIRSLSRQNEQLQKIIQEHGSGESPELKEELNLQFVKETAAYGK